MFRSAVGKRIVGVFFGLLLFCGTMTSQSKKNNPAMQAFSQGMDAFKSGDYVSAIFLLRKAVTFPENFNSDTYYMLISAQMQAEDYKAAYKDCEIFIKNFFDSPYIAYIIYHKARCLFYQKQYEKCILLLSDFCHDYPDNPMYASALFWIAECFFVNYNYDDALLLYNRILNDYSTDAKATISQYRIETITQSRREDKLLHLLKETGQEYLAVKEEYERQQKLSTFENAQDAKATIVQLQAKQDALQAQVNKLQKENNILKLMLKGDMEGAAKLSQDGNEVQSQKSTNEVLDELKAKAAQTQKLLDGK